MTAREIDGCRVEVMLEREVVRWEEEVKGRCHFHGGPTTIRFHQVEVRLHLPSIEGQVAVLDRAPTSWQNEEVAPGAVVERHFAIRVPPRAGLGSTASVAVILQHGRSWVPATLFAPVVLVPSRCFTDILELTTRLTGLHPEEWRTGALGDGVKIRLVPGAERPKRVDALQLELHRANGFIYGNLTVDPVNSGLAGALRNLTAADLVRLPIRFREGDVEDAAQQLTHHLRPFLHESARFPIPAHLAAQPQDLPIPAGASDRSREALPRPAGSRPDVEETG